MDPACRGDRRHALSDAAPRQESAPEHGFLDNIIVGYAFGPKKMETMGLIMAEASKALSTFDGAGAVSSALLRERPQQQRPRQQQQPPPDAASTAPTHTTITAATASVPTTTGGRTNADDADKEATAAAVRTNYYSDGSLSSTYTRASSLISQRSNGPPQPHRHQGEGGARGPRPHGGEGIHLSFVPDAGGCVQLVRGGGDAGAGASQAGSSVTTSATALTAATAATARAGTYPGAASSTTSCSSLLPSLSSSPSGDRGEAPSCAAASRRGHGGGGRGGAEHAAARRHRPVRVSFVPVDLDTPLEEQHGGKFDVLLHKMTEDILCMSKMRRAREEAPPTAPPTPTPPPAEGAAAAPGSDGTRHPARALRRLRRLHAYAHHAHPACVLVDPPDNIVAVMSRADMAATLLRCLAGVTTRGGVPATTPRFRVVEDGARARLAAEVDGAGFAYPLIAKPLTAAGTKSSHHMAIVLGREGLPHLRTPCLLQEYANHGETLFKVYVLGARVWVFARESLPNLPAGEKGGGTAQRPRKRGAAGGGRRPRADSYVEFERPAGGRCYVEFNSQRPYPKLPEFGLAGPGGAPGRSPGAAGGDEASRDGRSTAAADGGGGGIATGGAGGHHPRPARSRVGTQRSKKPRSDAGRTSESCRRHDEDPPAAAAANSGEAHKNPELARFVTAEELEPVTAALRAAFGLELFGFDVLVKHGSEPRGSAARPRRGRGGPPAAAVADAVARELLVVDVNYFPGYKEVPHFPALLAQYLTQRAVESRIRNQG